MFDLTENDVEIMLQHYGWASVGDLSEPPETQWQEYEEYDGQSKGDSLWHNGYDAFAYQHNGHHSRISREVSIG